MWKSNVDYSSEWIKGLGKADEMSIIFRFIIGKEGLELAIRKMQSGLNISNPLISTGQVP